MLPIISILCSSRNHPYSPHRRDWNFLGDGGFSKTKKIKKCMKFHWNFQWSRGSSKKSLPWWRYGYFLKVHVVYIS